MSASASYPEQHDGKSTPPRDDGTSSIEKGEHDQELSDEHTFPEGGARAWSVAIGAAGVSNSHL